jgi:prolyl-tRNA synthetase
MRVSKLFSQTLREPPTEAEVASHQLLVRAGFIRQLAAGIFSYLPLARRAMTKIEAMLREEINAIGGQEMTLPVVQPADLWKETGRWYQIGSEMGRFKDRTGHDMVLAMTHEEVVAHLVRGEIRSYRQLPALVYHIQTKWRDESRPRGGLVRVREFTMLDSYSLDATWEGLDAQYRAHYQAYFNIYHRCGLPAVAVKADTGMMGGKLAHEYMYLTPIGEDTLLFCDTPGCGYAANRQVARFRKPVPAQEQPQPVEKVATPHITTISDLARYLLVPEACTAKAVFLVGTFARGEGRHGEDRHGEVRHNETEKYDLFIFAVVRGDMELNEYKLANALGNAGSGPVFDLRPATEEEILATGAVPGYASPIGLAPPEMAPRRAQAAGTNPAPFVVIDDLVTSSPNLVAGANEEGYHLLNTCYGRDYTADLVADIVAAEAGMGCPQCGAGLRSSRGVEVGNIFKLGTRYSAAMDVTFLDENGQAQPVIMGSYGIGVGRLLACIAEHYHDERGLCWPISVAPYPIHLVVLGGKGGKQPGQVSPSGAPEAAASSLYAAADNLSAGLTARGMEPLFDDRVESAGVKFMDADLIGLPLRLTVSERSIKQGGVEFKRRDRADTTIVPLDKAVDAAREVLETLQHDLDQKVATVPYSD